MGASTHCNTYVCVCVCVVMWEDVMACSVHTYVCVCVCGDVGGCDGL